MPVKRKHSPGCEANQVAPQTSQVDVSSLQTPDSQHPFLELRTTSLVLPNASSLASINDDLLHAVFAD